MRTLSLGKWWCSVAQDEDWTTHTAFTYYLDELERKFAWFTVGLQSFSIYTGGFLNHADFDKSPFTNDHLYR